MSLDMFATWHGLFHANAIRHGSLREINDWANLSYTGHAGRRLVPCSAPCLTTCSALSQKLMVTIITTIALLICIISYLCVLCMYSYTCVYAYSMLRCHIGSETSIVSACAPLRCAQPCVNLEQLTKTNMSIICSTTFVICCMLLTILHFAYTTCCTLIVNNVFLKVYPTTGMYSHLRM